MRTLGLVVNPRQLKPWIRGAIAVAVLSFGVLLYLNYGFLRVPIGMDTMPDSFPGGTLCFVREQPSTIPVGAVVFVEVPSGTVLTRVVEVAGDRITVEHDNAQSKLAFGRSRGIVAAEQVRAIVLTAMAPNS